MMYYAHVIRSLVDRDFFCKGHCEDLYDRLKQHNSGQTKSIKHKIPFELFYKEEYELRESAIKREKYFKSGAGRGFIKSLFEN